MPKPRQTQISHLIILFLLLAASVLHLLDDVYRLPFSCHNLIFISDSAAILLWSLNIRRRIIQDTVRNYLFHTAALMILLMLCRTLRYVAFPEGSLLNRLLWYLYYAHILFISLFIFYASLYIGKNETEKIAPAWKWLYFPAALLALLVLSNDLHQLAFAFAPGAAWHAHGAYRCGPLYYLCLLFPFVLALAALLTTSGHCSLKKKKRYVWLSFLPLVLSILYVHVDFLPLPALDRVFVVLKVPEVLIITPMVFVESLVLTHLLPSNDGYERFWEMSSLRVGILEGDGKTFRNCKRARLPDASLVLQAEQEALLLDPDTLLQTFPIRGGHCFWEKDLSEINALQEELEDQGDVLAEENEMLQAESEMQAEQLRVKQQNQIFHDIAEKMKPHLEKLEQILREMPPEEANFREALKRVALLGTYIKRFSNLYILSQDSQQLDWKELQLAFRESQEALKLHGVSSKAVFPEDGSLPCELALLFYELAEKLWERTLPELSVLMISFQSEEGKICFGAELDRGADASLEAEMRARIQACRSSFFLRFESREEGLVFLLEIPKEAGV